MMKIKLYYTDVILNMHIIFCIRIIFIRVERVIKRVEFLFILKSFWNV